MKKYIFIFFFLPLLVFPQEDSTAIKSNWELRGKVFFELNINQSFPLGDHFLNTAYDANVGWELFINLLEINRIQLGGGYGKFNSDLTDASLAGNFDTATYESLYARIAYEFLRANKLKSSIYLGYGTNYFRQQTSSARQGSFQTGEFRLGTSATYILNKSFGLQLGVNYLTTNNSVSTSTLAAKNFERLHLIQVFFGLRFYLNPN